MTKKLSLADAEFALMCVLAVVLPILEAPKSLALGSILVLSVLRRARAGTLRLYKPDGLELVLIGLVLAAVVSTVLNWSILGHLKGLKDTLFGVLVCWVVYRYELSARRRYLLAAAIAGGVVVGLLWAVIDVWRGVRPLLEFNSAGIVTQSSIYLGVALVMSFGIAFAGGGCAADPRQENKGRKLWWGLTAIMLLGLVVMASRGAMLAVGVVYALTVVLCRNPRIWLGSLAAIAIAVAVALALPSKFNSARFAEKTQQLLQTGKFDEKNDGVRFDMWRIGLAQFAQGGAPYFGIGPRNFPMIDLAKLHFERPLTAEYVRLNHAHNLFITTLAEEGLAGLGAMLALFGLIATALVRDWRSGNWRRWEWFAALGALLVPSIAGSFNTPWQQEHAMLAMMLFGMYLSAKPNRRRF